MGYTLYSRCMSSESKRSKHRAAIIFNNTAVEGCKKRGKNLILWNADFFSQIHAQKHPPSNGIFFSRRCKFLPFSLDCDIVRWLQWMELAWVPSALPSALRHKDWLEAGYNFTHCLVAIPNIPSLREKRVLIRKNVIFPLCLPAFVFLFTVHSQSSFPITDKSGQGCSFSGLSLSALRDKGIPKKKKKIHTPYSTVLCENLYLPELDLSMTDPNVRHSHIDLTMIINYRHVLISKSSPWALMKGWTSKITSLLQRKHFFWVDWGLQYSIALFSQPSSPVKWICQI